MEELKSFLSGALQEIGAESKVLELDQHLEDDLGLESLMKLELATLLQKHYKLPFPDHVDEFHTVRDIVEYFQRARS